MKAGFVPARLSSAVTIASVASQTKPRVHKKPSVSWHTTLQARSSVLYLLRLTAPRKELCVYAYPYNQGAGKKQKVYHPLSYFAQFYGSRMSSKVNSNL